MAKTNRLWDYLGAVSKTKDVNVLKDVDFDKQYNPFLINRALSQHADSVLAAQLMNERHHLPVNCQFLFLLNTLRARYRKSDWLKSSISDDVKSISEYYGCSLRRASELLSLHTSEQLTRIYARLDKGGVTKGSRNGQTT
jgi:hypothetical protein